MELIELYLISVITVLIIDISGFIQNMENYLAKWIGAKEIHIHLIECSFCVNWWLSLIYIIFTNHFNLIYITIALLFSFLTPITQDLLYGIRETLSKIINKIL